MFIAFFNAGVRALDIRDPCHPREVGYFIPAVTDKTGVDRANTGLHILELSGDARKIANWP